MARIIGVDIPDNKPGEISLTRIYGIGRSSANTILLKAGVDKNKRVADWTEEESQRVRNIITEDFKVEGELKSEIFANVKRVLDNGSYRGKRRLMGLPLRGQRTKNNSRTVKGKRKTVANKKKAARK